MLILLASGFCTTCIQQYFHRSYRLILAMQNWVELGVSKERVKAAVLRI